ncbi:MAG: DEAD/DEAH box helicase [Treponema sp.]|jgi:ATP-dependent RNA helicase RhlB|nr:DEAD/DEAH box helicase [Treponema sp.]
MEFKELNLHPDLQRGIAEAEYLTCTPVQEQVLANAFGGQDLYVQSQTGTGKTAAFLIVIFQRLLTEPLLHGKKAIIMVPTRELAVQVEAESKRLGTYLPFKTGSFYGGVGYAQQQQMLRDNVQILVGTPGRVLDLNQSGAMNLMETAFLVLDEADRMFDMGFYPDLRKLIKVVPPADRRQTMLFSATLNVWVKNLAWEYTKSPFEIEITPETVTVDEVEQCIYHVPSDNKMKLLLGILERESSENAVIFCNTKRHTEIVAKRLQINGYNCEFIIGDLPQSKRLKIIDDIKAGTVRYLVATDVAARGLDIAELGLVINFDLPTESENYVHRIGRTARAGKTGKAVTLVSEQDVYELPAIEKYIGKKIYSETAGEGLYVQDKSEGMRIQTDFYENFHEGSKEKRGTSRRQETPESKRRNRTERNGRRGSRERGVPRGKGERRSGENRQSSQKAGLVKGKFPEVGDTDISHLSFDERMAYYKQKYGTRNRNASNIGVLGSDPEANRRRQRERSKSDKPGRGEGEKKCPQEELQQEQLQKEKSFIPPLPKASTDSVLRETPAAKPVETEASREEPPRPTPAPAAGKKGFFTRIFGLFKKD